MDHNEYATSILIKQHHAELIAEARRDALVRQASVRRRPWRAALGTALIRLGAWLLREQYALRTP